MKIRTFFYTIEQGILGIFKNKWFGFVTVATISACLFVFGIFYAIAFNVWNIVQNAEQNVSITVFFEEGITEERIDEIGDMIGRRPEVARYELVTAEEAWEKFSVQLGEYADGFTENPLENCANYQIYLGDVSKQSELVNYLEGVDGVRKINKSDFTADTLSGINMVLIYVFIGIILILFAVSIFLISNTVTMGISVRKEEITIMKYVGATDWFIRWPFMLEGMTLGLGGGIIACAVVDLIYISLSGRLHTTFAFFPVLPSWPTLLYADIFILACGTLIGALGSYLSLKKFLRV